MLKWIAILAALLIVASLAGILYVRLAAHDPADWHVDPATVTEVDERNQHRARETFPADPVTTAAALTDTLNGELLAGDPVDSYATYVVRTPLVGYPDYISVRIDAVGEGSEVTLFSRSRFGKSDLGANEARVMRILSDLRARLTTS